MGMDRDEEAGFGIPSAVDIGVCDIMRLRPFLLASAGGFTILGLFALRCISVGISLRRNGQNKSPSIHSSFRANILLSPRIPSGCLHPLFDIKPSDSP